MQHGCHIKTGDGFTLIEVLVAMVLVSMLTLVLALAFRMTLQAWERGNIEGESVQIKLVLPNLMARQLRAVISQAAFEKGAIATDSLNTGDATSSRAGQSATRLDFLSDGNSLSFYTKYSPMGTPAKGVIHVRYLYDPDEKKLEVFEQVIGGVEDIEDGENRNKGNGKKGAATTMPAAVIQDVVRFKVSFLSGSGQKNTIRSSRTTSEMASKLDFSAFEEEWESNHSLPIYARLEFAQTSNDPDNRTRWLFKVGGDLLQ